MITLAIGVVGLLATLIMDTSVASPLGGRINNIGLINDKQNLLLVFAACSIVGAIFVAFEGNRIPARVPLPAASMTPWRIERKCPFCAEQIKAEAVICRYCQKEMPPESGSPSNLVKSSPLLSTDISSAAECVSTLVRLGCRVTKASEDSWEVLHPSGVTAFARSPEALQTLASRYAAETQSPPQA